MSLTSKKLSSFFVKSRNWLLLAILCVLATAIGLFFWQSMSESQNKEGLFYVEQAEIALSSWEESDPSGRAETEQILKQRMEDLISLHLKGEAQARLLLLKGRYELLVNSQLDLSLDFFSKINWRYYQYGPALLYSAFIYEEKGEMDQALVAYQKLAKIKDPIFTVQGVFYQAVLKEKLGELDLAKSLYASLVADYPEMVWGQLSKNRLLYLDTQVK